MEEDTNKKICFVISSKYYRGYESYLCHYIENIKNFYKNSLIIIVDNNSEYKEDIFNKVNSQFKNIIILENKSECKFEIGAYLVAIKFLLKEKILENYQYYVFTQDTFILKNKFNFEILSKNNISACPIISKQNDWEYAKYSKPILKKLNLIKNFKKSNRCVHNSFVVNKNKIIELKNFLKNIKLLKGEHSAASERYLGRILFELNNKHNFSIDGDKEKISYNFSEVNPLEEVKEFFCKKCQNKNENTKSNFLAICGDSGSGKTTLSNILKKHFSNSLVLECDRYHKWERGNKNWKKITHLNPKANHLKKMDKDISNLKNGKSIYQVDYDHCLGKFTEPKEIKTCKNIIVSGLHTLYPKNKKDIYSLKIFMDTDVNLKIPWKIKRDTKERNHTKKYILQQIKKREKDYLKYVEPQIKFADLIIKFFLNKKESYLKKPVVSLKLLVSKKYKINYILNALSIFDINFNFSSEDEKFYEFVFKKYENNKLIDKTIFNNNNFYDYILFFILNIKETK